jgi:hypothetical protein
MVSRVEDLSSSPSGRVYRLLSTDVDAGRRCDSSKLQNVPELDLPPALWLASRWRRALTCTVTLTVVFLLASMLASWRSAGEPSRLHAWSSAAGEALAWRLSAAHAALATRRALAGEDEYGLPTLHSLCTSPPAWPLAPGSGLDAASLCAQLLALPSTLRVYSYPLPRALRTGGFLPPLLPFFNRGYPVEAHLLRWMQAPPLATRDPRNATLFLLPVSPYLLRVAAWPAGGLEQVQASVAAAVARSQDAAHGGPGEATWARRAGCDHVLVTAHDKGGRVAQTADGRLIRHGVLVASTADNVGEPAEWGRYTQGKDVAAVCSFSAALPRRASRLSASPRGSLALPPRTQTVTLSASPGPESIAAASGGAQTC